MELDPAPSSADTLRSLGARLGWGRRLAAMPDGWRPPPGALALVPLLVDSEAGRELPAGRVGARVDFGARAVINAASPPDLKTFGDEAPALAAGDSPAPASQAPAAAAAAPPPPAPVRHDDLAVEAVMRAARAGDALAVEARLNALRNASYARGFAAGRASVLLQCNVP